MDQYYNDPNNPNKQQILNRGIATQLSSQYQEFACGQWEYNDAKLEAKRPTMLKSYNKLNGEWVEVTPCNFEAGIKSGAVVSPYVMGVSSSKVLSDTTTSRCFKIERKNYGEREQCQKPYGVNRCQPQYFILILVLPIGAPLTKQLPLKPLNLIYAQPKIMKTPQPIILSLLKPPSTGLKTF
ncbi:hypothetical protein Taitung203_03610 [Helicobacter pylori]